MTALFHCTGSDSDWVESTVEVAFDGGSTILDFEDYERLAERSIYLGTNGYAYFSTESTGPVTLHSFVMGGAIAGMHIDHINGVKLDNRRVNLRFVTPQMNQVNRKRLNRNNTSGIRGVAYTPNRNARRPWLAQIHVRGRNVRLGMFVSQDEALQARRDAEVLHYGAECPR